MAPGRLRHMPVSYTQVYATILQIALQSGALLHPAGGRKKKKISLPKRGLFDLLIECMFIKKGVSKTNSPKRGLLSTSYVLYGRSSGH